MAHDEAVGHHNPGGAPRQHGHHPSGGASPAPGHVHRDDERAYVDPADFFNARAREWDTPQKVAFLHTIAEAIADAVPLDRSWRAVEIGAGTGLLGAEIATRIQHVVLTDVSPGMLEVAQERAASAPERLSVARYDLTEGPLAEPVDLIVASMVLHHVGDLDGLLTNLHASLRPGGWVALADLDPDPDNHYHEDGFGGHHGIDRAALQATLRTLGFIGLTERTVAQRTKAKDGVDYVHDVFLVTGHLPQSQGR
ncbi:class I SAM-dependent methyltransferase [Propioniciclava flava]|nr:class I SAM-dependent methyltransferase [Propioniciclava flava]